jgi:hypothetical protein
VSSARKTAAIAGALYLVTHVTSVTALILYGPVLNHSDYITTSGSNAAVLWGALLEGILALAVVGTAVTLFPIVRKQNESLALGYVGLRVLEAGIIVIGIVCLLAVVTLRRDHSGSEAIGKTLVALHNWTFLLGPSFVLGVSTVLLATVLYRSGLVPRFIPVLGLVGGPLEFATGVAVLFGAYSQTSTPAVIAGLPVFAWELSLAFWLIIKGFRPVPAAA